MNLQEYAAFDGVGLANLVREGQLSPTELAKLARQAIDKVNPALNAVIEIYEDNIDNLDELALGNGPFRGVPFLIKDIGEHLKGRKCENGSRLCQGLISNSDTYFGAMVRQSGVNVIGRTNTPEFSMASSAENLLYGATHNPWKRGHATGGSTGGGAAAVAAGMAPLAHGSDIGGSIRQPASWCGGVGLKPSRGLVSSGPDEDDTGFGMCAAFVQSMTMRDTALMLDCLSIPQPGDPYRVARSASGFSGHVGKSPPRYRIAFWSRSLMEEQVDLEIANAVQKTAEKLIELGHVVEEASPDFDLIEIDRKCAVIWYWGFGNWLDGLAHRSGRPVGPDTLERMSLAAYEFSKNLQCSDLMSALDYLNRVRRQTGQFFEDWDAWLTPTTAQVAPRLGQYNMSIDLPPEEFIIREERTSQFMVLYNATGQPAISLPLAMHSSGLPIGIQLAARPSEDHVLIELGSELEQAMPWRERRPPVHAGNPE